MHFTRVECGGKVVLAWVFVFVPDLDVGCRLGFAPIHLAKRGLHLWRWLDGFGGSGSRRSSRFGPRERPSAGVGDFVADLHSRNEAPLLWGEVTPFLVRDKNLFSAPMGNQLAIAFEPFLEVGVFCVGVGLRVLPLFRFCHLEGFVRSE